MVHTKIVNINDVEMCLLVDLPDFKKICTKKYHWFEQKCEKKVTQDIHLWSTLIMKTNTRKSPSLTTVWNMVTSQAY